MGHKASPAICDIVIYYLEEHILSLADGKIFEWLRFRDDVFALYTGNEHEATTFLNMANQLHPTLKFKYEISRTCGTFLDTIVFKGKRFEKENILDFKPYVKPSEKFQYIHRQSSHPKAVFQGFIKGKLMRFVRTATNLEDYRERAKLFREKLLLRGYSEAEFNRAFEQVHHQDRTSYLEEREKKKQNTQASLVFTTTYNPHLRGFRQALLRNWEIINGSDHLKKVFPDKHILTFRRKKNLSDTLVRARLKPSSDETSRLDSDELDLLISLLIRDPDTGLQN